MVVYHIRRRLLPKGGRPGYYGTNERYNGTYCGFEPTTHDVAWKDAAPGWQRPDDGVWFRPCAGCLEKRFTKGLKY
jgi:hypothetical protein